MEVRITIQAADGRVVTDDLVDAIEATDSEIAEMVRMIDAGTPAYIAAILAKQHED